MNAEQPLRYHTGSSYTAEGIGRNICTPAASYQEINTSLEYFSSNKWNFAAYAFNKGTGGETIQAKAQFTCVEGILRAWRTKAFGLLSRRRDRLHPDAVQVQQPLLLSVTASRAVDLVKLPAEVNLAGSRPARNAQLTRLLMTAGPDTRDVTIGRDAEEQLWVYSVSAGRAVGTLNGPACLLPSPLGERADGGLTCVIGGLTEEDDPTVMVVVDYGSDSVRCRVHERMWVSAPIPFELQTRPLIRWEAENLLQVREFRMAPLVADMLETGGLTYAPLP